MIFSILTIIVCTLLVLVILVQNSKGGGIQSQFGAATQIMGVKRGTEFIEKSPGLIRQKEDQKFFAPDIKAKESLIENEHLVTETLARIYALQGNINKAIRAYEILSLKFPQKSAYFATLIQKLKNN